MADFNQNIPSGMRDWLKGEAKKKRILTNGLLEFLESWGYQEVTTPILEYYQVLVQGESGSEPDQLYKLIDRDGSILALRPELTTPIARVVSSKIQGKPPWRLMYGGEVFRYEDIQAGKQRQFAQVGVELIGQKGPEADGEILALAIEALRKLGLEKFKVSLGHTGVLGGILQSLSGNEQEVKKARNLILEKDFVGLQHLLEKTGLEKASVDGLMDLLTKPLNPEKITGLTALPAQIAEALEEIASIWQTVENYGYGTYIQVDLSTLRHQTYYTGMVFEIYTLGIGYPIGGGGRYDHLLCRFGKDYPATGFALGMERLLLSLPEKEEGTKQVLLACGQPGARRQLTQRAYAMREAGCRVIADQRTMTKEEAARLAEEKNAQLCYIEEDPC